MTSRGEELFKAAKHLQEKKSLFGKTKNLQEASDRYTQSANAFKNERNFKRAGEAHLISAKVHQELKEFSASASSAMEAAKCFTKSPDTYDQAVEAYKLAISVYQEKKNDTMVADIKSEMASLLFKQQKVDEAINLWNEAINIYKETYNEPKAARHLEEIADIISDTGRYSEAADLYIEASKLRFKEALTQTSAGPLFAKAILCILDTGDTIGARVKLEDYLQENPAFRMHHMYKFVDELIDKIEGQNIEEFDDFIEKYKQCTIVDNWTNNRILDMRRYADSEEGIL
ncbi:vesicular-fusion protein SEC17 [Histomonas meleagridis]|uniref:vesicular-fusion protein SEC17 n=1 Tax=Histomonas meleagridis TaxID=135588 RepID=UPI00355A7441|nr:vesicular-fusion protein SEC17 [Histomonas meleagridis]KAH0800541.1 vesicular-fusion protein SEC17 [Histomonas meleagridis]